MLGSPRLEGISCESCCVILVTATYVGVKLLLHCDSPVDYKTGNFGSDFKGLRFGHTRANVCF